MSQNALSRKVNGNGKVILDTHPESDQHQNWTCSRGSPPASTHQIWWRSMNPFLRYLADKHSAHRQTHRHTDTRRWPQDLVAYGAQVTRNIKSRLDSWYKMEITECLWQRAKRSVANYAVIYGHNNSPLGRNAMFGMDRYNCTLDDILYSMKIEDVVHFFCI